MGVYNSCLHGCSYCYATSNKRRLLTAAHDPYAPMLTGYPRGDEIITNRTAPSQIIDQFSLF